MSLTVSEMARELGEIRRDLGELWNEEESKYLHEQVTKDVWPPIKEPAIMKQLERARRAVSDAETKVRKLT
jgi:hypothetical protein